ncbi:N-acetylmuramoyl-L-alanine amidase [Streptomyces sp. NPDC051183]|uniref:N-acetylmuramoyl-L-alanine amidase n=1 Tax=Streptomyces sp. NPDC051183 TaxID=3155165 RepID=UPI0034412D8E
MRYEDRSQPSDAAPPARPWYARRATLVVAAAAVAPTCLAGWVLTQVLAGAGPDDSRPPRIVMPLSVPSPAPSPAPSPDAATGTGPSTSPSPGSSPSPSTGAKADPLTGRTVVIDPGHNTGNFQHTDEIDQQVDIGTNRKECDTTGTTTNDGYMEAEFSLDVSRRVRTLLEGRGVKVLLTHEAGKARAWGPCIDERARIGNEARADAVVSVHADGVSAGNRGFHIILPAKVKGGGADTAKIVGPSRQLGERIAGNFARTTGSSPANYLGSGTGLVVRDDLGGLNLSTRPKVFIECGNMRDAKDAAQLTSPEWRQKAAQGIADGIVGFLGG